MPSPGRSSQVEAGVLGHTTADAYRAAALSSEVKMLKPMVDVSRRMYV